jgi:hypothetical protein
MRVTGACPRFWMPWAANARTLGYDLCQISHYMIRSANIFALHNLATPALGDETSPLTLEDYYTFNTTHTEDTSLLRWTNPVAQAIAGLRNLPDVTAAHDASFAACMHLVADMRKLPPQTPTAPSHRCCHLTPTAPR